MKIFEKKIILASKSPRRSQLLGEAGFQFEIKTKDVNEAYPDELPIGKVAPWLAEKKALECADFLQEDDQILLAADSVVILDGHIYGKPTDYQDAVRILSALSGREHEVVTGVCLLSKSKKRVFADSSFVSFDALSQEEIRYYLDVYAPFDKAGAYAIQEWIGLCKISKIRGTYTNIMGLPMELVYKELSQF